MSFDPRSSADRADLLPDSVLVCAWCDEEIDQIDIDVEAFEAAGAPCCRSCLVDWGFEVERVA